ncbi:MAG TPA: hypothetical protein VKY92_08875 [Verrucomicrobiae bacterium]|nr:hypothetical protein [Verrucomicrobiae bacterium]
MGLITKSVVLAALLSAPLTLLAQTAATNSTTSATNFSMVAETARNSMPLPQSAMMGLRLREPGDTNSLDYLVGRTKVHISGPAVRPLKAKSASEFGQRLLHLFSPFADVPPNVPPGAEVSAPVRARAWSTIVGWSPGRTAFPDDSWHEPPQIRLLSIRTEKLPKEP